jgi:hypothetical protein
MPKNLRPPSCHCRVVRAAASRSRISTSWITPTCFWLERNEGERIYSLSPRMEEMGTEAVAMALYAIQLRHQVPWRRSGGPVRRPANSENAHQPASLHRIMATPKLSALRQPRRLCLTPLAAFPHARVNERSTAAARGPEGLGHAALILALQ